MIVIRFGWVSRPLAGLVASCVVALAASSTWAAGGYRETVLADEPIGYWTLDEGDGVAKNLGTLGDVANGEYFGEDREADLGPDRGTYPGMPANNVAMRLTLFNETGDETPVDEASGVSVEEPILDELTGFTLSGWINPSEADNSQRAGLFGQDNAIEFGFIGASSVQVWTELPDGGSINSSSLYDFDNDEWHHIAITGDGIEGELFLYIDGEESDVTAISVDLILEDLGKDSYGVSGNPFNIGGGAIFGADRQFAGAFDEIAVFDKYLTEEQIQAHYQAAFDDIAGVVGDFNNNGKLDAPDIDDLTGQVADGGNPAEYDLNMDSLVNVDDINVWVKDLFNSWVGDANLDGEFNTGDLVLVLASGKYEVDTDSVWSTGDFNGDKRTNTSDLVAALSDGGYETGPRAATAAIPEPSTLALLAAGLSAMAIRRRRKN